jgi:phospholipid/cholesterol/gamma-HCH transport system substrate-binding protein
VPNRKEIEWSQLRVGALVMVALAVLIALIFLMSAKTGGLFAQKFILRAYFDNAGGLKNGAPVTLEGVTIGNVTHMAVVASHNPTPVEVVMQVGRSSAGGIHTDSTATITQAGVLGDSFVDIDSTQATGPLVSNDAVLEASGAPTVQDVVRSSQQAIEKIRQLTGNLNTLVATLNTKKGLLGELVNDPVLAKKFVNAASNMEQLTSAISNGQGTLGKLVTDDTLYNHAASAVNELDQITTSLNQGQGTAGKLLHDDTLYKNLNSAVVNTNQLVSNINSGKGALGKLADDPEFARKLDDTVTNLDGILNSIHSGQGTLGQLVQNRALFDHANQALDQAQQLMQAFRDNPKKYLQIHMKVF